MRVMFKIARFGNSFNDWDAVLMVRYLGDDTAYNFDKITFYNMTKKLHLHVYYLPKKIVKIYAMNSFLKFCQYDKAMVDKFNLYVNLVFGDTRTLSNEINISSYPHNIRTLMTLPRNI